MPKAKLVTRSATSSSVTADSIPKGSGLTNAELDSNFINLRDQGWRLRADDSTQHTITADTQINFSGGTITADANGDITVSNLGGGGGSLGNITGSGDTLSSSGNTINFNDPVQISTAGSTGTDIGNIARFGESENFDFNHQGSLGGVFAVYGSGAQQATSKRPFTINLDGTHEGCQVGLAPYNSSSLPTVYTPGLLISISSSGYKPAYYDGSTWRYVHDNSAV